MKFEQKKLKDHQVELVAEVSEERFEKTKMRAARRISKNARIPGFRPGKAPYDIIKRTFGEEMIAETALDILVNEIYPQLIKEADLKPFGPGKLEDIESQDPPKFRFTVPLAPVVELGDYKKIKQAYQLPAVEENEVKKILNNLQVNYATAEPAERAAEKGDLVSSKISATLVKPDEGQPAEILTDTPNQTIIGEESDEEQFPFSGFGEQLIGLKSGESRDFKHRYAKDSIYEKLRGKEAEFSVTIDSFKELKKPELDDEFAKTLGFPAFTDLEASVRDQLETSRRNEYDNQFYDEILDKIVKQSKIQYPPQMLDEEIQDVLKNIEQDIARQNLDLDTYLKLNKREEEEFIETDVKPAAQKRLEHALVMDEVGRQEKIELDQTELKNEYSRSFFQMQSAPNFRDLQKEFTTKKLSDMVVMQSATRLMNRRTLERLKAIATGEEIHTEGEADQLPADSKEETSLTQTGEGSK